MGRTVYFSLIFLIFANIMVAQTIGQEDMDFILRKVTVDNISACEKEDTAKIMDTIHTQSPGYLQTKAFSDQLFPLFDLKYELLNFRYLITDGDFALARVTQKTTKVSGPAFQDNILDSIFVYKQENGKWKFWSQVMLTIKYIN
ncbi:MAG: hypothetical protein ABIG64_04545 [Candidatus Omnitrophota bacterium]